MSRLKALLRSWKFRVLAVCLLLAAAGGGWWWFTRDPLAEFVDQDLRKLDDGSQSKWKTLVAKYLPAELVNTKLRLQKTLDRTLPEKYTSKKLGFGCATWHIWRHNEDSEPQYILLLEHRFTTVPSESRASVHFISSSGRHLACCDLSTGDRQEVVDASFRFDPEANERVLNIYVSPFGALFVKFIPTRLVFRVEGDRVALIRVEGKDGLVWPNGRYSTDPPQRSIEEWLELFASDAPTHVLEALDWVGRIESWTTTPLVADSRAAKSILKRVVDLCKSEKLWVREAAIAVQSDFKKWQILRGQ